MNKPAVLYPLVALCMVHGLPEPIPEYRFEPNRRWRLDYAFPLHKLAVEIEGGIWTQGRHTRGPGALADMEKYNALTLAGWRLLRYTPAQLSSGALPLAHLREILSPMRHIVDALYDAGVAEEYSTGPEAA